MMREGRQGKSSTKQQKHGAQTRERGGSVVYAVAYPGIFFSGGGVQQIQLRTERTGIWGAAVP